MKLMLQRVQGNVLVPADEETELAIARWPFEAGVEAEVKRVRNIHFHRKFFALVSVVAAYSEVYDNTPKALTAIKLAAGHVDWVPNPTTGELVPVPKSIAFANMDDDAFAAFYDHALTAVIRHLIPTMTRASLEEAVNAVMGFA